MTYNKDSSNEYGNRLTKLETPFRNVGLCKKTKSWKFTKIIYFDFVDLKNSRFHTVINYTHIHRPM